LTQLVILNKHCQYQRRS